MPSGGSPSSVRPEVAGRTDGEVVAGAAGRRPGRPFSRRTRRGSRVERLAPFVLVAPAVLSRTIQFVFVTTMIGMLTSMFGLLFVMTSGGPEASTYLPEYYIWVQQGQMNQPALASAASTALFLIMLVVGLAEIAVLRRAGREG